MASWQRLRHSLRLEKGFASDNVCWRCALRQTRQYSYTTKASALEKKRSPEEKQQPPLEKTAYSQRDRESDLQRQIVRKHAVREAKPVSGVAAKSIRRIIPKSSSETTMDTVDEEGQLKYIKIGIGGHIVPLDRTHQSQPSEDKSTRPRIHRRTLIPPPEAMADIVKDASPREALKTGHRRIVVDTAVRYVQSPKRVQEADKSVEQAESQRALNDVLNAFDDLYARLGKDPPKAGAGLSVDSSRSAKAITIGKHIRSYTTSTTRLAAPGTPAISSVQPEPAIEIPLKKDVGIRDQLRAWQEQEDDAGPVDLELRAFPIAKSESQQNVLAQSSTSDGDSFLLGEDESLGDENILSTDAEDLIANIGDNQTFLRSGDLVELLTAAGSILAIYIRNFSIQSQFYTMQGKWVHRSNRKVKFAISPFSPPAAVDRIIPYLPPEEVAGEKLDKIHALDISVPREAGAELIQKMLEFQREANAVFRKNSERLDRAYKLLAHPTERRLVTTEEAAMKLLQIRDRSKLTDPMLWAVHRILVSTRGFRMSHKDHRISPIFDVLPQSDVEEISRVWQWLREYQEQVVTNMMVGYDLAMQGTSKNANPFYKFIASARTLITESRRTRAITESGTLGPSSVKVSPVLPHWAVFKSKHRMQFDSDERQILEYIHQWVTTDTVVPGTSLASLGPMILRATGMYEGLLTRDTGFVFLQEMGVIPPWQNRIAYNTTLNLPGHRIDPQTDRLLMEAKHMACNFEMTDSMQHLRKDWGGLEVFCIDDADAAERDDGISLEPVDGSESEYWMHMHVANPSSFISPDSCMGRYAAHVTQSIYFPEQRFPMFMPSLVEKHFSLAKNTPSITFSARIRTDGEILETSITNGVLHNVRHLTKQTIRRYLSHEEDTPPRDTKNITVGGGKLGMRILPKSVIKPKPTAETLNSLTKSQIATLRKLGELGEARRRKRERDGAVDIINQQMPRPEPTVYFQAIGQAPTLFNTNASQQFEGDPIISLDFNQFDPVPKLKSSVCETLVPDCMILAGEIAATWCGRRNIPIPYRGTLRNPEPAVPPDQFKKEVIDPAIAKKGYSPLLASLRYLNLIGRSSLSTTPLKHIALGAPYYCKITSPLRRYTDLMAHWQIEAAIRHEAETGTSLIGNATDDSYLPFSRPTAEAVIAHNFRREDIITRCSRGAARHWYSLLFFRAFYFNEAPLPETSEVYVYSPNSRRVARKPHWSSMSKEYGINVELEENEVSERAGGIMVGDWWEARIIAINVYLRCIDMAPVRLIERTDDNL